VITKTFRTAKTFARIARISYIMLKVFGIMAMRRDARRYPTPRERAHTPPAPSTK
jgi:hypothetical protein